ELLEAHHRLYSRVARRFHLVLARCRRRRRYAARSPRARRARPEYRLGPAAARANRFTFPGAGFRRQGGGLPLHAGEHSASPPLYPYVTFLQHIRMNFDPRRSVEDGARTGGSRTNESVAPP